MNSFKHTALLFSAVSVIFAACNQPESQEQKKTTRIIKGLYSYGPEIHSFTDC